MNEQEKKEFRDSVKQDLLSAISTMSIIIDNPKLFDAAVEVLQEYLEKKAAREKAGVN